jgi:hypothetical protein
LTHTATECQKLSASEAPKPGRHHVGTPGDIISECPGDFVGIRTVVCAAMSKGMSHVDLAALVELKQLVMSAADTTHS